MATREMFEAEFPVPDGVYLEDTRYTFDGARSIEDAIRYSARWIGFQAGVKAAGGVK